MLCHLCDLQRCIQSIFKILISNNLRSKTEYAVVEFLEDNAVEVVLSNRLIEEG